MNSKSYRSLNINLSAGLTGCSTTSVCFYFDSLRRREESEVLGCHSVQMFMTHSHSENKQRERDCLVLSDWNCHFYMLPRLHILKKCSGGKNSTPQWIALKCVNVCANPLLPFSMTSYAPPPPPPPPPLSRLRPPLSQSLSPCDLITPLLISFDRRQLIRGQHLEGRHGNRQDQIFWALKGGSRSGLRGGQ